MYNIRAVPITRTRTVPVYSIIQPLPLLHTIRALSETVTAVPTQQYCKYVFPVPLRPSISIAEL